MDPLSCDESITRYADLARPRDHARDLASRMVTRSRADHDFGAMSRWGRRCAELEDAPVGESIESVEDWYATTDLNREPAD